MPGPTQPATPADAMRVVKSEDLFAGQRVLLIRHGADEYRLQITASGKLILTK